MNWQKIQRTTFTSWGALADFLELDESQREEILRHPSFPLKLPLRLAEKIQKKTLDDPILLQFLPLKSELEDSPGYLIDPVGDTEMQLSPNLLQKYKGRSLLIATGVCAMHCRFCLRQNYPYESRDKQFDQELNIIAQDQSIEEIILSGGDPLSLSNPVLKGLFDRLKEIPHLKRVRFHTRFPIGIPERIDDEFMNILKNFPKQCWFIIHVNHARELDEDIFNALEKIQKIGIPVLNHAVLLKNVNDKEETLFALYQSLANRGISAYYLNQLDRVKGSLHFEVTDARGIELIQYLEKHLPGYAVPKFVREIAGKPSKTPLPMV